MAQDRSLMRHLNAVPAPEPAKLPPLPHPEDWEACDGRWWGPYGCVDALCSIHGNQPRQKIQP